MKGITIKRLGLKGEPGRGHSATRDARISYSCPAAEQRGRAGPGMRSGYDPAIPARIGPTARREGPGPDNPRYKNRASSTAGGAVTFFSSVPNSPNPASPCVFREYARSPRHRPAALRDASALRVCRAAGPLPAKRHRLGALCACVSRHPSATPPNSPIFGPIVALAKAGVQGQPLRLAALDSRFRGNDGKGRPSGAPA